jgi:hypothetical protein
VEHKGERHNGLKRLMVVFYRSCQLTGDEKFYSVGLDDLET